MEQDKETTSEKQKNDADKLSVHHQEGDDENLRTENYINHSDNKDGDENTVYSDNNEATELRSIVSFGKTDGEEDIGTTEIVSWSTETAESHDEDDDDEDDEDSLDFNCIASIEETREKPTDLKEQYRNLEIASRSTETAQIHDHDEFEDSLDFNCIASIEETRAKPTDLKEQYRNLEIASRSTETAQIHDDDEYKDSLDFNCIASIEETRANPTDLKEQYRNLQTNGNRQLENSDVDHDTCQTKMHRAQFSGDDLRSISRTERDEILPARFSGAAALGVARLPGTGLSSSLPTSVDARQPVPGFCRSSAQSNEKQAYNRPCGGSLPGAYSDPGRPAGSLPSYIRSRMSEIDSHSMWDSQFHSTQLLMEEETERGNGGLDDFEEDTAGKPISCTVINDRELSESIQHQILLETDEAEIVQIGDVDSRAKKTWCIICFTLTLLAVLSTVIGLSVALVRNMEEMKSPAINPTIAPTIAPTHQPLPTLEVIHSNGAVRCGVKWLIPLETDLCRALAAAVLGDPEKIVIEEINVAERWKELENKRSVDIVTMTSTHTMHRDIYLKDSKSGFTFSAPYLYDGLAFGGITKYVKCADSLDTYFGECAGVRICVSEGSTAQDLLIDYVADINIRVVAFEDLYKDFLENKCNVLIETTTLVSESRLKEEGYHGTDYSMGKTIFMNEPLSMVTREDDPEWSNFVTWVLRALFAAEEQNITNSTASTFATTTVFGDQYNNMFVNAINAVGNYGDLYQSHVESLLPRKNLNLNFPNNGSTGLHYAFPIGKPIAGPDPVEGSTIYSITKQRGHLNCGIFERAGFGVGTVDNSTKVESWQGMDADYCYALSASLFQGNKSKVSFVRLQSTEESFHALNSGEVDVIAGGKITLESNVKEASTGKGYTFSIPYYFGLDNIMMSQDKLHSHFRHSTTPDGAIALVTREDDPQWSDFVFWVVMGTFIAEDKLITKDIYRDMVDVFAFGSSFKDMHRHAISAVGNYGEIYKRSVESIVPRKGRNLLNTNPFGPQLYSYF